MFTISFLSITSIFDLPLDSKFFYANFLVVYPPFLLRFYKIIEHKNNKIVQLGLKFIPKPVFNVKIYF